MSFGKAGHRVKPGFMAQTGCPRSSDPQSAQAGEGGPENESDFKNLVTGGYVIRKGRPPRETRLHGTDRLPEVIRSSECASW
mmetsp:Transcript_38304/g.62945  ORF Transcript_38304/g.62945 Transcript_38304/m.62945 type:complete len:82 (-) Transcript_38304:50-295(-)